MSIFSGLPTLGAKTSGGSKGKYKAEMYNIQNKALNEFSDFTAKIFNQILFKSISSKTK